MKNFNILGKTLRFTEKSDFYGGGPLKTNREGGLPNKGVLESLQI